MVPVRLPWSALLRVLALVGITSALSAQTVSPFQSGAWSGNVTATSATVCIRLAAPGQSVRLAVSTSEQLSGAVFSTAVVTAASSGNVAALNIAGLQPNTAYFYGFEVAGVLRTETGSRGRFRTFPQGAGSFKIALVGDGDFRDADQRAYDAVLAEDPLLLLFNGDLHYLDVSSTVAEDYRVAYDSVLKHPAESAMLRGAPIAYMWDDHDFSGGDNSIGTAVGASVARAVYRDYVPHYPLPVSDGTIGQAFTVGRVRIIMTDLRSAALSPAIAESPEKTKLGVAQKAWFKQELVNARDAGFPLIIWLCTEPWIGAAALGDDSWAGYTTERTELANFIRDNRIRNLVVYGGDMHALAYDDGTHSDYATGGGAPLVVLHAAPLTRDTNIKGGPYTVGPYLGSQQYGMLEVVDTGGPKIQCKFTGKRVNEGAKLTYEFSASSAALEPRVVTPDGGPGADRALVNLAARGRITSSGDTLIAGFVVGGRSPRNILLRGIGPALATLGVRDALPFPMLSLYKGSTLLASNENWGLADAARLTAVFDRAGAFRLVNGSRDAVIYVALDPGAYTVQASSFDGSIGSVLLEVYEVP